MKNLIKSIGMLTVLLFAINAMSYGQNDERFQIKSPFKKSTYNGKEVRKMSNKELKAILSSDQLALSKYKSGNAMAGAGSAILCIGSFLVLYNTLQESNGLNDGKYESDQTLASAGIVMILCSIPFYVAGGTLRKNAIKEFRSGGNKDISIRVVPILLPEKSTTYGVSINVGF